MLLLLDHWPLERQSRGVRRLLLEKLPLFLIAIAAGVLTIWTQRQGAAVRNLDDFTLYARVGNAVVSYIVYLRMLVWPYPLAVFYPHLGDDLPVWAVAVSMLLVIALTVFAVLRRRSSPYLLVGWLWYVIALAPVSGILQAGWQGRADRFLYVPSIGLFLLLVWSVPRKGLSAFAVALAGCVALTALQLRHWRDSLTLWEHTFAVTEDNFTMRDSLAAALLDRGRVSEAIVHLERARELKPDHELSYYLLGIAARSENRLDDATRWFGEALRLSPRYVEAQVLLAEVRIVEGRFGDAEELLHRARDIAPRSALALSVEGVLRERQDRKEEALSCLRESVRLDPHAVPLRLRLIEALRHRDLDEEASCEAARLRRLFPGTTDALGAN
jgi:tetratricopeptide (TPR) repeat protein